MQALDERLDTAMSTLADAEQRLSLAEQSGAHAAAEHLQQQSSAQARCACLAIPQSYLLKLRACFEGLQSHSPMMCAARRVCAAAPVSASRVLSALIVSSITDDSCFRPLLQASLKVWSRMGSLC